MNKKTFNLLILCFALTSTSAFAKEYTIGDIVGGIGDYFGGLSNSSNASSSGEVRSNQSEMLVKDLTDLPKLSDKPFVRGVSKLDYAEMHLNNEVNRKNYHLAGGNTRGEYAIWLLSRSSNQVLAQNLIKDLKTKKVFDKDNTMSVYSNPSATFEGLFDLTKINEIQRTNPLKMYTYALSTHFKIPNELVDKKGQVIIESPNFPIYIATTRGDSSYSLGSEVCHQMINNDFLKDTKGVYSVKKGNILDYQIVCYFAGELPQESRKTNSLQSLSFYQKNLPKEFKVYSTADSSANSYTLSNRDIFLYANEFNPAKK